jgi:predicted RNase H-like HicB family nuclease
MGEREKAEVRELEEELAYIFREHPEAPDVHRAAKTRSFGVSGSAWTHRVVRDILPVPQAKTGGRESFEMVLPTIDLVIKRLAETGLPGTLASLWQIVAAAIMKDNPQALIGTAVIINRLASLDARLRRIEKNTESLRASQIVPITTVAPEPYEICRPLLVTVQPSGEEYVAGFFDANVYASGDTEEEAVTNLKSVLLDVFDSLSSEPADSLGPEPARQLAVLREFIAKRA